jgi:hypothetical protein
LIDAGLDDKARAAYHFMVQDFQKYLSDHRDQITALQVLCSRPYAQRLRRSEVKALAETLSAPPRGWTPEKLWRAYEAVDRGKVRGGCHRVRRLPAAGADTTRFEYDRMAVPNKRVVGQAYDQGVIPHLLTICASGDPLASDTGGTTLGFHGGLVITPKGRVSVPEARKNPKEIDFVQVFDGHIRAHHHHSCACTMGW